MTTSSIPKRKCPQCQKETAKEFRPFCSKRCQQLDLGKWFNESYVIPGQELLSANDDEENY
ncbi:MAG: DNA gyrase inhibitor YacG [Sneathiella sp.]